MKPLIKTVSENLLKTSQFILLFSLIAGLTTVVSAQRIYDELNKKKTIKSSTPKEIKKKVTPKKSTPKPKPITKKRSRSKNTVANKYTPPTETTAEILSRYMDYEQSSGVNSEDWQSVLMQTTKILNNNPNDTQTKAQYSLAQGELAYDRKDYPTALNFFNSAAQIMPNSVLPHYGIGKVYLATKQNDQAENAFEKAIKINEKFALAYSGLGQVMRAKGKTKKAAEYFNRAGQILIDEKNSKAASSQLKPNFSNKK